MGWIVYSFAESGTFKLMVRQFFVKGKGELFSLADPADRGCVSAHRESGDGGWI
jgi:hypothetical protein